MNEFRIGDVYESFDYGSKNFHGWLVVTDIVLPDRVRRGERRIKQVHYTFYNPDKDVTSRTYRDMYVLDSSFNEKRLVRVDDPAEEAKIFLLTG